jgi:hypothetical protein
MLISTIVVIHDIQSLYLPTEMDSFLTKARATSIGPSRQLSNPPAPPPHRHLLPARLQRQPQHKQQSYPYPPPPSPTSTTLRRLLQPLRVAVVLRSRSRARRSVAAAAGGWAAGLANGTAVVGKRLLLEVDCCEFCLSGLDFVGLWMRLRVEGGGYPAAGWWHPVLEADGVGAVGHWDGGRRHDRERHRCDVADWYLGGRDAWSGWLGRVRRVRTRWHHPLERAEVVGLNVVELRARVFEQEHASIAHDGVAGELGHGCCVEFETGLCLPMGERHHLILLLAPVFHHL